MRQRKRLNKRMHKIQLLNKISSLMEYISTLFFMPFQNWMNSSTSNLHISYSIPPMFELIKKHESKKVQLEYNGRIYFKKTYHESFLDWTSSISLLGVAHPTADASFRSQPCRSIEIRWATQKLWKLLNAWPISLDSQKQSWQGWKDKWKSWFLEDHLSGYILEERTI